MRIIVHTTKGDGRYRPFCRIAILQHAPGRANTKALLQNSFFHKAAAKPFRRGTGKTGKDQDANTDLLRFGIRNMAATMATISSAVTTENQIPLISQTRKNQDNTCPEPASTQEGHQRGDKLFLCAVKKNPHK
ncbi:MAG: hypothetical protein KIG74_09895 [Clostridiaceae bacterium]|nr:hypothetical protein [Clostridiaceae bacterium]